MIHRYRALFEFPCDSRQWVTHAFLLLLRAIEMADTTVCGMQMMPASSVRATIDSHGRGDLTLFGDIDMTTADALTALGLCCLLQLEVDPVVINLAAVTFIDAGGLGALVALHNAGLEAGRAIRLDAVPVGVARLLRLTSLGTVFTTHAGPDQDC